MKIKGLYIWCNLLAMAVVAVLIVAGVFWGLDRYTLHGEEVSVPDVREKTVADASHMLESAGLRMEVGDTGYARMLPSGCVLEQLPAAGSKVKSGRLVRVIVNSGRTPTLTIPDVIDNNSYREARAYLTTMGFKVGEPQYVAGERDWVYGIRVRGRNVTAGDKVSVDDVLTIQVGNGTRDEDDDVFFTDGDGPDGGPSGDEGLIWDDDFEIIEE